MNIHYQSLKELSCPNQALNTTCGPMKDLLVFSVCYHLVGVVINVLMIAGIIWDKRTICIPWLVYQISMCLILIVGPFLLLYYNVPDWNRYEIRNGIVNDYPERWQPVAMIVPNLLGILCLYIFCHGMLVFGDLGPKPVDPDPPKEEPKPSVFGGNVFVINAAGTPVPPDSPEKKSSVGSAPIVQVLPSAPPKEVD